MPQKNMYLFVCIFILALAGPVLAFTMDQASSGKGLYIKNCSACHGVNGEGSKVPEQFGGLAGQQAPRLIGPGSLPGMSKVDKFYKFASKNMPKNKPGSLKSDEYLDIVSFVLEANGVKPDGNQLTPKSAKKMKIPGR